VHDWVRSVSVIVRQFVGPIFGQYGVRGVLTLIGAALLFMIVVVGWLGVDPERKAEGVFPS
jgi:ribulose 1,5-bisphosphate carboxylase large subunit-like protein